MFTTVNGHFGLEFKSIQRRLDAAAAEDLSMGAVCKFAEGPACAL